MRLIKKSITLLFLPIIIWAGNGIDTPSNDLSADNVKIEALGLQQGNLSKKLPEEASFLENLPSNLTLYFRTGGFGILSLDNPIGGPSLGLGARYRSGHFGCSASVNASTYVILPYLSLKGEFLCYFSEDQNSYFTGVALESGDLYVPGFFGEPGRWQRLYQPEVLIGREYKTSTGKTSFINIGITPPMLSDDVWSKPVISFNYGIGF